MRDFERRMTAIRQQLQELEEAREGRLWAVCVLGADGPTEPYREDGVLLCRDLEDVDEMPMGAKVYHFDVRGVA